MRKWLLRVLGVDPDHLAQVILKDLDSNGSLDVWDADAYEDTERDIAKLIEENI